MSHLVRAEALRMRSRRLYKFGVIAFVAIFVGIGAVQFVSSRSSPRRADATRAFAERVHADCLQEVEEFRKAGIEGKTQEECPPVSTYLDRRFRFVREMAGAERFFATVLVLFAAICGASFMGAEWAIGGVALALTYEARRTRLLVAKMAGGSLVIGVTTMFLLGLLVVVHLPAGLIGGNMDGANGHFWGALVQSWVRGGALAAWAAILTMAIASWLRNTAATILVTLGYGLFVDPFLASQTGLGAWLVQANATEFLKVRTSQVTDVLAPTIKLAPTSIGRAALLLGAYLLVTVLVTVWRVERVDV